MRIYDMITFDRQNDELYTKEEIINKLSVHGSGFVRAENGWAFKKDFLGAYRLIHVDKGSLSFKVDNRQFALNEGEFVIINPFLTLDKGKTEKAKVELFWIDFSVEGVDVATGKAQIYSVHSSYELQSLMHMSGDCVKTRRENENLEPLLVSVIYALKANGEYGGIKERVNIYLEEHLSEYISVKQIAASLNYSRDHLSRILSKETGMSLKSYINRHKIDAACMLLHTSALSVAEIGEMTGFKDANLFTKFFKYHMKVTPSEYRRGRYT